MEGGKFVGGSALARKRARQIKYAKPEKRNQQSKKPKPHSLRLPNKVSPSDRFFASLLLSSTHDIIDTNRNDRWTSVIGDICNRAGVPFPSKLNATDHDLNVFFLMRASLILEEARSILAEELSSRARQRQNKPTIDVKLVSVVQKKNGFTALVFTKLSRRESHFSPSELYNMKPGCVVEVAFRDEVGCKRSVLTHIMPVHDAGDTSIALLVYRLEELDGYLNDMTSFHLIPVTTLISEQRQFAACFDRPKVSFLPKLMGIKSSTHTRFDNSDDESESLEGEAREEKGGGMDEDGCENENEFISFDGTFSEEKKENEFGGNDHDTWGANQEDRIPLSSICIPSLNESQEKAAISFINGPAHNLSLVQGPPGTGKTTFMTAVLCRTLLIDYSVDKEFCYLNRNKRVLVAAPTNKAISVLASRFLRATNGYMGLNVVLIGVEDSLFPPDENADELRSLKGIFVYSWVEELMTDMETLMLDPYKIPMLEEIEDTSFLASFLVQKLTNSIPQLSQKFGSWQNGRSWLHMLKELPQNIASEDGGTAKVLDSVRAVNKSLSQLLSSLKVMKATESAVAELLNTANVIFSTLTTSGLSLMKRTRGVHELFVDEAAATTEAEIIIPLHLRPRRMLAVGDPKQLPASVTSRRAAEFGLDKSLLDRLMFECGKDHMMLDVQYRMSPAISAFPSTTFYDSKLRNGQNVSSPSYKGEISIIGPQPYTFINVNGSGESRASSGSYYNAAEANAVLRLVQIIQDASRDVRNWASIDKIRIITFYSGQVRAIKDLLRSRGLTNVTCATVDSSQGSEADIVIVSFVRSNGNSSNSEGQHNVGFLNDDRRINVALTRAKYKLFCLGDANTLLNAGAHTITDLVNNAKSRNLLFDQDILK